MRHKETSLGWNPITGAIMVDDNWWDKKIKEKPKYRPFRKKPVSPEMSELWDMVFGSIVATGKNCVATTMDPSQVNVEEDRDGDEEGDDGDEDGEEEEWDEEDGSGVPCNVDLSGIRVDGSCDDVLLDVHEAVIGAENPTHTRSKPVAKGTPSLGVPTKRKKKKFSAQSLWSQHIELMGETSQKFMQFIDGDGASSKAPARKKCYDLDEAMAVIDQMVLDGSLVEGSPLWCVGMVEAKVSESRELFMRLKNDHARLSWLQFQLDVLKK